MRSVSRKSSKTLKLSYDCIYLEPIKVNYCILVVCIGNICRSPLGEYAFKEKFKSQEFSIKSAGLGALVGYPADPLAIEVGLKNGLDLSQHEAQMLNQKLVNESDLILVMSARQKQTLIEKFSTARGKVFLLSETQAIADPFQKGIEHFEEAWQLIELGVESWVKKLA